MKKRLVSAKEITKGFGISYQTVNSYTDLGLLDVVSKKNHMRMYDYDEVKRRLLKISRLINEGYTLRLIRRMINEGKRK
jgi:DNA-binding transcriptional MerR regulator